MSNTPKPRAMTVIGWAPMHGAPERSTQQFQDAPAQSRHAWGAHAELEGYESPPLLDYPQPVDPRPEDYVQPAYLQPYGPPQGYAHEGYGTPGDGLQAYMPQGYAHAARGDEPQAYVPQGYVQPPGYGAVPSIYPRSSPDHSPSSQSDPYAQRTAPYAYARPDRSSSGEPDLRADANVTVGASSRVRFIRLTYLHLFAAILAFGGLEYLLMTNEVLVREVSSPLAGFALGGRWNWGIVLAGFMAVSWIADFWARHATSRPVQYVGLLFYVVAEAVIFVPLLAIVTTKTHAILAPGGGDPNIIYVAASLALFSSVGLMFWYVIRILTRARD